MKAHQMCLTALLMLGIASSPRAWAVCTSDAECSDGLTCNGEETCNLGTELCEPGAPLPDGLQCQDGNPCSTPDTCQAGICTPGPGDDVDGDGDCDDVEITCGCDMNDGREVCVLPSRLIGRAGNRGGEVLMEWFAPEVRRVVAATDPSCATVGECTAGYCTRGRIRDVCTTNAQCDLPPETCRVVVNWGDIADAALDYARIGRTDVPGFTPVSPGCSRKIDVSLDTLRRVNRLRLRAHGTVDLRLRPDRDTFRIYR